MPKKGYKQNEEHKQRLSDAQSGENSSHYGKPLSDEHRESLIKAAHRGEDNAAARFVVVNGEKILVMQALKKYDLNRYTLARNIVLRKEGFAGFPDTETFIQEELDRVYKRFPLLPSKEQMTECKNKHLPFTTFVKTGVTYGTICALANLHGISTKFNPTQSRTQNTLTKDVLQDHLDQHRSAAYIATLYDVSPSFILTKIHEYGLPVSQSFTSIGEIQLREYIESLGFKTIKYDAPTYEIDVFVPELNIGFEYNGIYWHSTYPRPYHQQKYLKAQADGIHLIQIWENDWEEKTELIKRKIRHVLGKNDSDRVFARKTTIETVSSKELREFYATNHIQGWKAAKHNFVLRYNTEIVAALSIQKNKIERYATSTTVVGGFSKLLKQAVSDLGLAQVETFADLFWTDHLQNQYIKSGFDFVSITPPNYFWYKHGRRYSRLKFQKHKLTNMPGYALNKSESEIMKENKYLQVYDAGNAKFIKTF